MLVIARGVAIGLVLVCTACAPAVRFSTTTLPVEGGTIGPIEMIPDQCHWGEVVDDGVVYSGLEFTSGRELGTMIFLGRERGGPSILPETGRGLAVIWRVVGTDAVPAVFIPASECEVFRLTTDTSVRLGGATSADFEIRCAWEGGATFVGKGRFTETCL